MKPSRPSSLLASAVMVSQLFGPGTLWALEQRGVRLDTDRLVVSALSGDQLTVQRGSGTESAKFRTGVQIGDRIVTGVRTVAEVLISDRTMVTLDPETTAQVVAISSDQTTIQVVKGMVRVAAAPSAIGAHGLVRVQTPTSQVQTRGGIVRVAVDVPVSKAGTESPSAQAYRASSRSDVQIAATTAAGDLIQVEEGTADIIGAGAAGGPLTIQAGQRVMVQAGRAGAVAEGGKLGTGTTGIVATTSHTQTPKEGRDHLVALQVTQATQLGKALTGAAETEPGESGPKSEQKNTINGATGGVTLVTALFGSGNASSFASSQPLESTGNGAGGLRNNGPFIPTNPNTQVGLNNPKALLVFTQKDPVISFANITADTKIQPVDVRTDNITPLPVDPSTYPTIKAGADCDASCIGAFYFDRYKDPNNPAQIKFDPYNPQKLVPETVGYRPLDPIVSNITVSNELLLIGGSSNTAHGGIAPTERLIVRGASGSGGAALSNYAPLTFFGAGGMNPPPPAIAAANSNFVVETPSKAGAHPDDTFGSGSLIGGTLGQYSATPSLTTAGEGLVVRNLRGGGAAQNESNIVNPAITATGSSVTLKGGVALDQKTTVTIGQTTATNNYFSSLPGSDTNAKYSGSLLSVINGPAGPTKLSMQERMLGVYDGSIVQPDSSTGGKALLSVLDAKLVGPSGNIPLIDIAAGSTFTLGDTVAADGTRTVTETPGRSPSVTVTSAIVTRSTTALPAPTSSLDQALLNASAPLIALTKATMTTTSHFADVAGNATQSLNLNGALVALSAANLFVKGNLLNLNTASAAISGYLFSLSNGSMLDINSGSLFSMNDSSLALNGTAFGVFGSGTNTLKIDNNLCGTGMACGRLVDGAHNPITLANGTTLKVAGVTHDVVLPNNFNVFAGNGAGAQVNIGADDALFQVKGNSHLTINGVQVQ